MVLRPEGTSHNKRTKAFVCFRRNAPAPWAVVESDLNGFVLPSAEIRALDPRNASALWEDVVKLEHNFIGEEYGARGKEWGCHDIQLTFG